MPAPAPIPTIVCPNCKQTLPFGAQICQFCKTDVRAVARPVIAQAKPVAMADSNWKIVAYYVMGVWWILNGLLVTLGSAKILSALASGPGAIFSGIPAIGIIIGLVYTLSGLGMVLKVEIARGVVNILSWITIGFALMRGAGLLLAGMFMGPAVLLMLLRAVFDGLLAGFQIYLIAETDKFM